MKAPTQRNRPAKPFALVFVCAALLVPATTGLTHGPEAGSPCPGFQFVPGQGPSCPVPGGWDIRFPDGTTLTTHGPDLAASNHTGAANFTARSMPTCVDDPANEAKAYAIYAFPPPGVVPHSGFPPKIQFNNKSAARIPEIRDMVNRSNAYLQSEAAPFGVDMTFKFTCDTPERISVAIAELKQGWPVANAQTIIWELQLMGFKQPLTKYWIFYEGTMGNIAGQGSIMSDDRANATNANNRGSAYALTYGQTGAFGVHIMVHEAFHTMGAVQNSAPNSSGGFHCNDGWDTMCYADGGSTSNYTATVCAGEVLDCNNDDYFHPDPPTTNYLFDHWNVGSPLNDFLTYE